MIKDMCKKFLQKPSSQISEKCLKTNHTLGNILLHRAHMSICVCIRFYIPYVSTNNTTMTV